jgi:hypothetical protein
MDQLDAKLTGNEIDLKAHTLEKRKVDEKYSTNL